MRRAAVIGHPIAHSLSPVLHNAAYRALGLDWEYSARSVLPTDLAMFLADTILRDDSWVGFSVTMPLKSQILSWLLANGGLGAGSEEAISPFVAATGIANTLYRSPVTSELRVANTDIHGIVTALREVIRHGPIEEIAILGNGATAASALAAALELGADTIAVYSRESDAPFALRAAAERLGVGIIEKPLSQAAVELAAYDAVISTMPKHAADLIDAQLTQQPNGALLDVVYDPSPTALVATWSALGGGFVGGERMLLHQAARQVELMTGLPAPLAAMDAALARALVL